VLALQKDVLERELSATAPLLDENKVTLTTVRERWWIVVREA
jgi:hypothetical protein